MSRTDDTGAKMRDRAYCGLFGALALALPVLFHALGLAGPMFLPMYWPLVTLAYLVSTRRAVLVAACVPLASMALTGMPLPPLAPLMSVELAVQVAALGIFGRPRRNRGGVSLLRVFLVLAAVLVAGRFLHTGLLWLLAREFPTLQGGLRVITWTAFLSGWPGVVAMLVFVPVFVGATARRDGVCEVRFLKALRRLHLPEGVVLVCAQTLRWFEALGHDAEMLSRAMTLRRGVKGTPGGERPQDGEAVRIANLQVRYPGASRAALEIGELVVGRGEKVALLGPNGCGKTTLLSVLAGFAPYAGDVRVFGFEPRGRALREVRRRIGVLFENPDDQFLFPTVREDVGDALARRGVPAAEIPARVDALLARLGLPTGNRPVASLSRGQRQRVALASLLAAEPDLLLLDEPTSALDDAEKARLADVLARLPAAVLVSTHDRDFANRVASRRVELVLYCSP